MNTFTPFARNWHIASFAEAGMRWEVKLTKVPSMSKNIAFITIQEFGNPFLTTKKSNTANSYDPKPKPEITPLHTGERKE